MRADDPDVIEVEGPPRLTLPAEVVIGALSGVVTPERLHRIERVARGRTADLAVVLDGLTGPHNASAVLRSADAFGVQRVYAIVGKHGFRASAGVSKGTQRWLDVMTYESPGACLRRLREEAYEVYVATMNGQTTLEALRSVPRLAVVFGNEHHGASPEIQSQADGTFCIPMRGFVESLNVSVAAAITMQALTQDGRPRLSSAAQRELVARFLMNSVKDAETIIEQRSGND